MEILIQIIFFLIVFGVFWFIFIRPQKKRQEDHKNMLTQLEVGDDVVTIGGIKGSITKVDEEEVSLKIASEVEIKFNKGAIAERNKVINNS